MPSEASKRFFFEKKNQKTFVRLGLGCEKHRVHSTFLCSIAWSLFLRSDLPTECDRAQMSSGIAEGHREAAR
jgi:hypothetical protein